MAAVLDGKVAAAKVKAGLVSRVLALKELGVFPGLGTVLVGDDPGSRMYVAGKHRDCLEVGIASFPVVLPGSVSQLELEDTVLGLNADPACTGYIVQLPLPAHIDMGRVLGLVDPVKDADGLHPNNLGRLVLGVSGEFDFPLPCTPRGILELLRVNGVGLGGKHVVVVGRGVTVGRSLGLLFSGRSVNATVTLTHTGTLGLADFLGLADVVVAAVGVGGLVEGRFLKPGVVVLDVGVSRVGGSVVGDVALDVWDVASWVSPNPGGVGPMTRAMLLTNVVEIAERALFL